MLQPVRLDPTDLIVPYLKAGLLDDLRHEQDLPTMYASPNDLEVYRVTSGDLLVVEGGDFGRADFAPDWLPQDCIIQNSLFRVRPRGSDIRFVAYALETSYSSGWLEVLCNRATFGHLTREKLSALPLNCPDLAGQRAIADLLDAETGLLDALKAAEAQLHELVTERFRARVAWLVGALAQRAGETLPLKALLRPRKESATGNEQVLSVYRDHGVLPKDSRSDNFNKTPEDLTKYQRARIGDVVINKMKAWRGSVAVSNFDGIVSPDYLVCTPTRVVAEGYLHYLLRSPQLVAEFARRSSGIRPDQWRIYFDDIRDIKIPWPTAAHQAQFVEAISRERQRTEQISLTLKHHDQLLSERRTALVTDAVEGRLSIPGVAA